MNVLCVAMAVASVSIFLFVVVWAAAEETISDDEPKV